nr:MAG TPA: hypothetical protein [Bacteriophage sp.]
MLYDQDISHLVWYYVGVLNTLLFHQYRHYLKSIGFYKYPYYIYGYNVLLYNLIYTS